MNTQHRYTIGAGTHFDKNGAPIANLRIKIRDLKLDACKMFGGCAVVRVEGGWVDQNGKLIEEDGVQFDICTDVPRVKVELFAGLVKTVLNQTAVLFVQVPVHYAFL